MPQRRSRPFAGPAGRWLARLGPLSHRFALGTAATLSMKLVSIALRLAVTLLLTRLLGVTDYGVYVFIFALMSTLSEPLFGGLRTLAVRCAGEYYAVPDWPLLHGLRRRLRQTMLLLSVVSGLFVLGVGWLKSTGTTDPVFHAYALAALMPLFLGQMRVGEGLLLGQGRTATAQFPKLILRPVLTLLFFGPALFVQASVSLTQAFAMLLTAALMTYLSEIWLEHRAFPPAAQRARPTYRTGSWLRMGLPLGATTGLYMIEQQGAVLVLGLAATPEETGQFHVAMRVAELVMLVYAAVNIVLEPIVARFHAQGDTARIQRAASMAALVTTLATGAALVLLTIWGRALLAMFGEEFIEGHGVLQILVWGHLINALIGTPGSILPMMDHAGESLKAAILGAILTLGLCFLLIPSLGLTGAAWATASGVVVSEAYMAWRVYRLTGVNTTVTGVVTGRAAG